MFSAGDLGGQRVERRLPEPPGKGILPFGYGLGVLGLLLERLAR
jgi:16S rRNA G1207 methylase RsmC